MPSPQGGGMVKAALFRRYAAKARRCRTHRAELGYRQQGTRAQRFHRVHDLWAQGNDLYLLHVLRKRMEYPELRRAVREQCQAFETSVVLI
jgi:hypothetical protein